MSNTNPKILQHIDDQIQSLNAKKAKLAVSKQVLQREIELTEEHRLDLEILRDEIIQEMDTDASSTN